MCGRYALFSPGDEIARWFGVESRAVASRYNIAPGQAVHAVVQDAAGGRDLVELKWGLVPPWSRHPAAGLVNARVETAAGKPAFREAFRRRRCVLPASGFYEWAREGAGKRPWFFASSVDTLLALAAIWNEWQDGRDGGTVRGCAILTTESRGAVQRLHHRMPLLVDRDRLDAWLDGGSADPPDMTPFTWSHPISARPASRAVNSVSTEGPRCLEAGRGVGETAPLF